MGRGTTTIRLAQSDADKEAIYRLRYRVYIEEMGGGARHTEADTTGRQLYDEQDEHAYHFMGFQDGELVACARICLRRERPLECEDLLSLARFAPAYPSHISMTSRLVIDPRLRGTHLLRSLACSMYEYGRTQGMLFDFIDCHPRLLPLYSRLGYRIYKPGFRHPKYVYVVPMVLVGDDLEHLAEVKSPFLSIAKRLPSSHNGRELLIRAFPDSMHKYVSADQNATAFWSLLRERLLDRNATVHVSQVLSGLAPSEVEAVVTAGHIISCKTGDAVLNTGDPGREIFLILEGSFLVHTAPTAQNPTTWRLRKLLVCGDIFGEVAFLTEGIRHGVVSAMEDSTLLVLNSRTLDRLAATAPEVAAKFFQNLARIEATRLRDTVGF